MNRLFALPIIGIVLIGCNTPQNSTAKPVSLTTQNDSISYMIGQDIGKSFKSMKVDSLVVLPVLLASIEDVITGKTSKLSDEKLQEIQANFSMALQKKNQEVQKAAGDKNLTEGKAFLENNKNNPGVKTTASGLQYIVVKEGKGEHPKATDKVKVHYKGTLLDGKEFDSSYKRGEPAVLALNQVIPGWTEGIQLMTPGSSFKFFLPPELAYGDRQAGPDISPNSTLIFEVELISIEK